MGTSLRTCAKAAATGSDGRRRLGTDENSAARRRHSFFKMKISAARTVQGWEFICGCTYTTHLYLKTDYFSYAVLLFSIVLSNPSESKSDVS